AVLVVPPALKRMVFVLSLLSAMAVLASSNVLFVRVSEVARPTSVSVDVGKVRVPVLEIVLIIGVVNVLLVSVCVVLVPTRVVVASGRVTLRLAVWAVINVVVVEVVPVISKR